MLYHLRFIHLIQKRMIQHGYDIVHSQPLVRYKYSEMHLIVPIIYEQFHVVYEQEVVPLVQRLMVG